MALNVALTDEEERKIREISKGVLGGRLQDLTGFSFADTPDL
jgi:hypothetical protein